MNKKVTKEATAEDLLEAMRSYPLRTNYTAVIAAFSESEALHTQHKCKSIVDSLKTVVSCADPPPPQDWVSISLSCVLIVLVVAAWSYGCVHAKKVEEQQKALQ